MSSKLSDVRSKSLKKQVDSPKFLGRSVLLNLVSPERNNTYQNLKAYDWKKMMADTGSQSATELVSKLFTPVYMPSPMNIPGKPTLAFYMYK